MSSASWLFCFIKSLGGRYQFGFQVGGISSASLKPSSGNKIFIQSKKIFELMGYKTFIGFNTHQKAEKACLNYCMAHDG